jgi:hypothetical protein
MHPPETKRAALDLIAAGHNDCEVSRRTGIARTTIRDWRRPSYKPRRCFAAETCPRCWRAAKPMRFTGEDYAELLAYYLGDGCISEHARTCRLRIALDARYPEIICDAKAILSISFPENPIGQVTAHGGSMVFVSLYSSHLPCLFPQHAAGMKYQRRIALEPWQAQLVAASPWPFIRGCIRTDGCSFINRTGPYEYLSYAFSNMSGDIVSLFTDSCARVGVATRVNQSSRTGILEVRINQRSSVALMAEHVGVKA